MNHYVLDAYGVKNTINLFDIRFINQALNLIALDLNLKPVAPAFILPYDHGVIPVDNGVSAYLILQGGHLTIHSFPLRSCYFLDLFTPQSLDLNKLNRLFQKFFPFDKKYSLSLLNSRQTSSFAIQPFEPKEVFGPHVLGTFKLPSLTMESLSLLLESLISDIGMTPITRAQVLTDNRTKPTYLTGFIMIAESHISVHYHLASKTAYFDIFSCKMFDYQATQQLVEKVLGKALSWKVIVRGEKHQVTSSKLKTPFPVSPKVKRALNYWKEKE
jgi:S-adenosylmethionine/arginine decarboxylase-like enzyme